MSFLLLIICFIPIYGWFLINKHVTIRLENVSEPYYFDVLIEEESAPILSETELNKHLPEAYKTDIYLNAMNGFRTEDGFVSFRLYADEQYRFENNLANVFDFEYYSPTSISYRIAIIYADDGEIHLTEPFTIIKPVAEIKYNLVALNIVEKDAVMYELNVWPYQPSATTILLSNLLGILIPLMISLLIFYLIGFRNKKTFLFMGLSHIGMYSIITALFYWFEVSQIQILPFIISFVLAVIMFGQMLIMGLKTKESKPISAMIYILIADILLFTSALIVFGIYY
jgi:hypothetical protein